MRLLTLLLVPAALLAGQSRFARLGEFQGQVEVQLTAADPWIAAERNLPLTELAWLRTGAGARVEIEMDDGSLWRLGPNSLGEISDYTRLSTGQRITLLSLDHGTAYYTGQPAAKDVTMLVMPGAQMTVLQGSRVRQTAQPGLSQAAILEGLVRFSSPAAEMDLREGTTAQVEPANTARFSLEPEIAPQPLDRWSEDRDKAQAAPASAAYVNAAYGLADLDSAGKWVEAGGLGMVWKPEVSDAWAPYQNGRWRYYDALGYTWVSADSWGWMPYRNGRWSRVEDLGWVWQPSPNPVLHPAEVYWLRGSTFVGWGPLAPGEDWNAPNPGALTPQGYTSGSTSYAAFQPDARTIDSSGFAMPAAEQFKTAFFVPALPSPAFLPARLDAQRPMIQVGSTRVVPSVPEVTFGDSAPADLMTNPPADAPLPQPVSDVGIAPPPDGVYPVPAVIAPTFDTQVYIGSAAPPRPTYSPRPAANSPTLANNPPASHPTANNPTTNNPATNNPTTSNPTTSSGSGGNKPSHPTDPAPPVKPPTPPPNHPVAPPVTPPIKDDTAAKKTASAASEQDYYRQVLQDIDPKEPNFSKALSDLNTWSHRFPNSSFFNDRSYFFVHVYNRMDRPEQVLDAAAPLVQAGVRANYPDPQQVLQILVAASASFPKLRSPTAQQVATGQKAAHDLLQFLPEYFAASRRPSNVGESAWSIARGQLEDVARQALAYHPAPRVAAAH
jgi:hypothetical protein